MLFDEPENSFGKSLLFCSLVIMVSRRTAPGTVRLSLVLHEKVEEFPVPSHVPMRTVLTPWLS